MKASDLPYEAKQQFLKQLQQQIGSTEYYRLVDTLGEDGVIDLALKQIEEVSKDKPVQKKKALWKRWGFWLVLLVLTAFAFFPGQVGTVAGYLLMIYIVTVLIPWVFEALGKLLSDWWDSMKPPRF